MSRHMAGPDAQEYPASLSGFADVQLFLLGLGFFCFFLCVCPFLGGIYYFDDAVIITSTVNLLSNDALIKCSLKSFFFVCCCYFISTYYCSFLFKFLGGLLL